ncbi:MAG: Undecaprenyl-diphosphatase [Phycisphaerae bacterium]|nr:Undecaprenyl-diphosphatase [Phycisphaerae bacterium]
MGTPSEERFLTGAARLGGRFRDESISAMDYLRAVVLGVVEGLTEFLPVSSTGHMILVEPLIGVDPKLPQWRVLLIVSQLGAILAVIAYFARDLRRRTLTIPEGGLRAHLLLKLAVGVAPAMLVGVLMHDVMESHLQKPVPVAAALVFGAVGMILIDGRFRRESPATLDDVTLRQAAAIGVIQCVSLWPGVSRSAATIMGGMIAGLSPRVSAEFSFYLAIPTMLAAGAYQLYSYRNDLTSDMMSVVLVGTATAFVTALAVISGFLRYVQRHRFTAFAVYRIVLGAAVLAWFGLNVNGKAP